VRVLPFQTSESDRLQSLVYACPDLISSDTEVFQGKSDLMFDRRGSELRLWVLEHYAHLAGEGVHWVLDRIQTGHTDSTILLPAEELGHDSNQG
jgi:hypothetical protein